MSPAVRRPFYQRNSNPFIRYELIPNYKDERLSFNSLGFRDDEVAIPKPEHTYRIVLLGDSETMSYLLPQDEKLDNHLENILNVPDAKMHYEVINTGVEGYGTLQELEVLRTKVLRLEPDLVILNYCLNDPDEGEYHFNDSFLVRNCMLYRYIWYRTRKAKLKRRLKRLNLDTEVKAFHHLHSDERWDKTKGAILDIADLLQKRDITFVVNIFPTSSIEVETFQQGYPYEDIHEKLHNIQHQNIVFLDPIEEFNRLGLTPQQVSIDYEVNESHKTSQALQIMAQFIVRELRADKILPD